MRADGTEARAVTKNKIDDSAPSFSPDGLQIAFVAPGTEGLDIFTVAVGGTGRRNLTQNEGDDFAPDWSHDGQIVFTSERGANLGIQVAGIDGSAQRALAPSPGADFTPRWSPDGTSIAFASDRDGDDEIFVVRADGSHVRQLTHNRNLDDRDPAWSPDGSQLAFVREDADGATYLYAMSAEGRDERFLLEGEDSVCCPAWSPDGAKLAVILNGDLVVVGSNGKGRRLVSGTGSNGTPAWSPDGKWIVFDSGRGDGETQRVFIGSPLGGLPRPIAEGEFPEWSPDGRLIAFSQGDIDELQASIYVIRPDGHNKRRVPMATPAIDPSWQPNRRQRQLRPGVPVPTRRRRS